MNSSKNPIFPSNKDIIAEFDSQKMQFGPMI